MGPRILVPIDGSEPAIAALRFAFEHHPEAEFTVIHVVSASEGLVGEGDISYFDQEMIQSAIDRGEGLCERAREMADERGIESIESAVQIGRPSTTIVAFAEEHDIEHIVLGSHGRSGVARLLLGSVAETVARRASVPVTIVR